MSNCLLQETYDELTKVPGIPEEKNESNCHESCLTCSEPNNEFKCLTCSLNKCLRLSTGLCSTCPLPEPIITDPNDFFQTSTMTFTTKPRFLNDVTNYKIVFSEEDVFFNSTIDMKKLALFIDVE